MADPVVAVTIYAETRGYLSLSSYNGSRLWWAGARMRLKAARRAMDAQAAQVEAYRLFAEMGLGGINTEEARSKSMEAQKRYERAIKPWIVEATQKGDDLDLVASWYIMYQPDRLKKLGVDFAPIESISQR